MKRPKDLNETELAVLKDLLWEGRKHHYKYSSDGWVFAVSGLRLSGYTSQLTKKGYIYRKDILVPQGRCFFTDKTMKLIEKEDEPDHTWETLEDVRTVCFVCDKEKEDGCTKKRI